MSEWQVVGVVAVVSALLATGYGLLGLYDRLRMVECEAVHLRKTLEALNRDTARTRFLVRGNVPESEMSRYLRYWLAAGTEADTAGGQE